MRPRDGSDFSKILRALSTSDINIGKIWYLDDNHRKADNEAEERGSNLVQLCDLLAGCCSKMFEPEEVGPDRKVVVERFATLVRKSRNYHEYWSNNLDTASFPEESLPEEGFFSESAGLTGEMYEREIKVNSNYRKDDASLEKFL